MSKNLTIGRKLAASFGVVIVLAGLLSYSSLATVKRLGGKLKIAVNEDASSADLGEIKLDLRTMKERSTQTQFSYTISNVLKVNPCEHDHLGGLENCASCHALARWMSIGAPSRKSPRALPRRRINCCRYFETTRRERPPRKFGVQLRTGVRASMNI
jgi:hypothetical protein